MSTTLVQAPASLILDLALSPSAKLIWMVLRLHHDRGPVPPAVLETRTGLSRKTILKGLSQLGATGWYAATPGRPLGAVIRTTSGARASIPGELLADDRVGIPGRILYGGLQLTPRFSHPSGQVTYSCLSAIMGANPHTIRRAARELAETEWIHIVQKNRVAPVQFSVCDPGATRGEAEVARVWERIKGVRHRGEALMREYLSLLVDSRDFEDNAAPRFLLNPFTAERLELDRYYPPNVAFEFNGPQHYGATERFSAEYAAKQRGRDCLKLGLCMTAGVTLVVIHAEDLTLETMREKVGQLLPLRDLRSHEQLITFLRTKSGGYRSAAEREKQSAPARTQPRPLSN